MFFSILFLIFQKFDPASIRRLWRTIKGICVIQPPDESSYGRNKDHLHRESALLCTRPRRYADRFARVFFAIFLA